jgi:hypothetical protein
MEKRKFLANLEYEFRVSQNSNGFPLQIQMLVEYFKH